MNSTVSFADCNSSVEFHNVSAIAMGHVPPEKPTLYCRHCSYALDGLPENRCPECGEAFDPADETTFRAAIEPPRPRPSLAMVGLGTCLFVGLSFLSIAYEPPGWVSLALLLLVGFVSGLRGAQPVMQAVAAGAVGYLAVLSYQMWEIDWNLPATGDTPCIPLFGMIMTCLITGFGGALATLVSSRRCDGAV